MSVSIFLIFAYAASGLVPLSTILSSWKSDIPWITLAALLIVTIVQRTTLLQRMTYHTVIRVGGSYMGIIFAATPDLRLAPLVPLDQPLLTQSGLLTWVSDTITGAMSLNFLEWREKLEAVRPNFDDDTFKSFLSSLESSGILNMIQEKRLSASSVATGAPVIIASGLVSGKATWRIEFPLIVSYESSQGVESTQRLIATVLVCRASTATTPRGVVIQQVVLKRES